MIICNLHIKINIQYKDRFSRLYFIFNEKDYEKLIRFTKECIKLDGGLCVNSLVELHIADSESRDFSMESDFKSVRDSVFRRHDVYSWVEGVKKWKKKTDALWEKINKE